MSETITLDVRLRAYVRRDDRNHWIASCPTIDVVTQGVTADDAKRQLDDAVRAWFDDCLSRGTLDAALRECGWGVATGEEPAVPEKRMTFIHEAPDDGLGSEFAVRVMIPAYQTVPAAANV